MVRRYEFVEGTSSKFWEIELSGAAVTTRWGRLGTGGQAKTLTFDSEAKAQAAHDKLVKEKEGKGYSRVGASGPTDPGLEATLAERPDDPARWKVYGDWLQERGEAWGEVLAQAGEGGPGPRELAAQAELLEGVEGAELTWRHGAIEHLSLCPEEYDEELPMDRALARILAHPAGRLVRRLTLGLPPTEDGEIEWHLEAPVRALASAGPLPLLEVLDLARPAEHMDQVSWRRVGDVRGLWRAAPRLKELRLLGSRGSDDGVPVRLAPIDAPSLETLVFESGGLDAAAPEELGAASLPRLKHLELHFGMEDYGCSSTVASLAGILSGKGLPSLQTLALRNSEWEAELVEAVAASPLLPRLKVVDFSMGTMAEEAARALVRLAPRFAHLERLVLEDNYFGPEQAQALSRALPNAVLGEQKAAEDEYRYVSVGE